MSGGKSATMAEFLAELPPNILVEILVRLPLETLLAARCVCKPFLKLTSPNPLFTALHSANAPPVLIFQLGVAEKPSRLLHWLEPELDTARGPRVGIRPKPLFLLPRLQKSNMIMYRCNFGYENMVVLMNSCNGLIYLANTNAADERSIVCNPVTNEYLVIPDVDKGMKLKMRSRTMGMWLGFDSSIDRYKILRISVADPSVVWAQVFVVGSGSWRDIDDTPLGNGLSWDACTVLLNGIIYGLDNGIVSFDFEKEKFGCVALPQEYGVEPMGSRMSIGMLWGRLCLSYHDWDAHRLDLWAMRRDGNQGERWSKEFVVDVDSGWQVYGRFIRPLQVLRNGEILMLVMGDDLVCYDPRKKSLRYVRFRQLKGGHAEAVTLTPSFASLKDILRVDKVIPHYDRPRASWKVDEANLL